MTAWTYIFWISLFLIFYNYLGYGLLVWILNKLKRTENLNTSQHRPPVSFIVAAFNEEDCIDEKIRNSLQQDYPKDRIEYIFITDGSSDRTMEIILQYPQIRLLHSNERGGKTAALNRAVAAASNEILIFSDANTILNPDAVLKIAAHYASEKVGGVAGEKKVLSNPGDEVGAGEGLYWKYESFLKRQDSRFYSVVGAAGELFSLRRSLYQPVPQDTILDDFIISMEVALKGFRIVYEPEAFAAELPSASLGDEQKRKIRIAAGGFQALGRLGLKRFLPFPRLFFLYFSHRIMRWTVSPVCLILAFISNAVLLFTTETLVYELLFAGQALFYAGAGFAGMSPSKKGIFKVFRLCYYFVFMNTSVIQGFFRHLRGAQSAAWEKAKRQPTPVS